MESIYVSTMVDMALCCLCTVIMCTMSLTGQYTHDAWPFHRWYICIYTSSQDERWKNWQCSSWHWYFSKLQLHCWSCIDSFSRWINIMLEASLHGMVPSNQSGQAGNTDVKMNELIHMPHMHMYEHACLYFCSFTIALLRRLRRILWSPLLQGAASSVWLQKSDESEACLSGDVYPK